MNPVSKRAPLFAARFACRYGMCRTSPASGFRLKHWRSDCRQFDGESVLRCTLICRQRDGRLERQGRPVLGVRSPHSRLTTSNSREQSAGPSRTAAARPRDMTIKRSDHVSVVVDDLAAAIAFFTALCMTLPAATSATCDDCRSRPMPRRSRRWVLYTPGFLLSGHTGAPLVPQHFRFGRRPSLATELTLCR